MLNEVSILDEALLRACSSLYDRLGLYGIGNLDWVVYLLMPGQVPSKFAATNIADDLNDVEHE